MRSRYWVPIAAGMATLVACSDGSTARRVEDTLEISPSSVVASTPTTVGSAATTAQPPLPTTTSLPPSTVATSAPAATAPPSTAPLGDPVVTVNKLGDFKHPVDVSYRPDGTIYVAGQDGTVVIMKDGQPDLLALDMTDLTSASGERGLLGLAISPDGALAYVDYTDNNGNTAIDEYAIAVDGTFAGSSRRNVLSFDQPYPNHNGGEIVFGPDRLLYIGTGDGGSGGDPERRALNVGEWLGKILRIDPHQGNGPYTVPGDNPFVGVEGARPEIWSVGFRNPWRFNFDRETGDLWIADVGQNAWEEVDVAWAADGAGRGMNFGWSAFEGTHRYNEDQSPDGATPPVYEYPHGDAGCSISGGVRYRGKAIPALVGWYVFGDYCGGRVRALRIEGTAVTGELVLGEVADISAVTEAPDGELLVLSLSSGVYAIGPG